MEGGSDNWSEGNGATNWSTWLVVACIKKSRLIPNASEHHLRNTKVHRLWVWKPKVSDRPTEEICRHSGQANPADVNDKPRLIDMTIS